MPGFARKIVLPEFHLTTVALDNQQGARELHFPNFADPKGIRRTYFVRPVPDPYKSLQPGSASSCLIFRQYPVVLLANGEPWKEANLYLLDLMRQKLNPTMSTYLSIADDLVSFRNFIDEFSIDWLQFSNDKLEKPTYRYFGYLKMKIMADGVAASTQKRKINRVISFYRWLIEVKMLVAKSSPWAEKSLRISFTNVWGSRVGFDSIVTDLHIKSPKKRDPYDGTILDGGKLRPLNDDEVRGILTVLMKLENTEMMLIHLFSLATGARIQTVLTMNWRALNSARFNKESGDYAVVVGPNSGVDTKNNKKFVIYIPSWLYEKLAIYKNSERYQRRVEMFGGTLSEATKIFLSQRGGVLYQSKETDLEQNGLRKRRYLVQGQAIREFIKNYILPEVRRLNGKSEFSYKFHDLRATFGMYLTRFALNEVELGELTLQQARDWVSQRMAHETPEITDRYLNMKNRISSISNAEKKYSDHLRSICGQIDLEG